MKKAKIFTIAQSHDGNYARLVFNPQVSVDELEVEGARLGRWLLENSSTSFLRGLQHIFDEAEIAKKVSLGY